MSLSPHYKPLLALIDAALDDRIDGPGAQRLEQWLAEDDHAVVLLVRCTHLNGVLERNRRAPIARVRDRFTARHMVYLVAACIVLCVGIAAGMLARRDSREAHRTQSIVATLIDAEDATWEDSGMPTQVGSQLPGGWLKLVSGMAQIEFVSGAQVTVRGPAEFGLNSEMRGFLQRGNLTAFVPKKARGFTIAAPGVAIVDLGTRFGVSVDPAGSAHVQVFEGEIQLQIDGSKEPRQFLAGTGARVTSGQLEVIDEIESPDVNAIDLATAPAFDNVLLTGEGDIGAAVRVIGAVIDTDASNAKFGARSFHFRKPASNAGFEKLVLTGTSNLGTQFTLAAMVRSSGPLASADGLQRLFSAYDGGGPPVQGEFALNLFDDHLSTLVNGQIIKSSIIPLRWNVYHAVAMTYDNGDVKLYFNGVLVGSGVAGRGEVKLIRDLMVGGDSNHTVPPFIGHLDDIVVLNRAMNGTEISALARNGADAALSATTTRRKNEKELSR